MSLLKVNSIEAYSGTSISLSSDILFKNITTGSSVSYLGIDVNGKIISGITISSTDVRVTGGTYSNGTATFTNSSGDTFNVTGFNTGYTLTSTAINTALGYTPLSAYTDTTITGGTYSSGTATFTNNTGGTFNVTGFTDNLNISDAKYTVNNGLNASGTTTATTSVMTYGVNVFTGVTSTNYATKLPQPITGKSVKVMNKGLSLLHIFPSNIGGQINNLPIDTPAVIPPDGNLYEFICIENPLPGAWTFSTPATGQYDSGELSISISGLSQGGSNPVISAYDSASIGTTQTFSSFNWGFDGKNKPAILRYNSSGVIIAFRPETPWKGIAKIKVYTNLVNSNRTRSTSVRLLAGGNVNYYSKNDSSFLSNGQSQDENELFNFFVNKPIGGNAVTASTIYTSANIGDAGTLWAEKIAFSDQYNSNVNLGGVGGTFIGNKDLGDVAYPYGQTWDDSYNEINTGDIVSSAYSSYISFQIQPFAYDFDYGLIPDFKFRFFIEYYQ